MSQRVRRLLAGGRKVSFGELYQGVLKGGPATKFAVRSALGKAREKGAVRFDGERYSMATPAQPRNKKPPRPVKAEGASEAKG